MRKSRASRLESALDLPLSHGEAKGLTAEELAQKKGFTLKKVHERLKALAREGRLGFAKQGKRGIRIDGQPYWTPVYWLRETKP